MSSTSPPAITKAWIFHRPGPYRQTLTLTDAHPLPPFPPTPPFPKTVPNPEEWLLLRVSYAALNPADLVTLSVMPFFIRSHRKKTNTPVAVAGVDFTADVIDVWHPTATATAPAPAPASAAATASGAGAGAGASSRFRFAKGDQVVCFPPLAHLLATGVGALQGVVALPARYAVKIPAGKTKREAAGLFLAACTADVQVNECGVAAGQRVLIVGASGGVGAMVVQMVRDRVGQEGRVVAVCSGRNEEMVKGLGADEVIDYTQHAHLPGELARRFGDQPFDHIIDAFGNQEVYRHSARYLKAAGMYNAVSIHYADYTFWELLKSAMTLLTNSIWPRSPWLGGTGRRFKAASMTDPGLETMERIIKLFGEGKLRVAVDSEWPFEKVHDALDVVKTGHAAGKVIIKVNEE